MGGGAWWATVHGVAESRTRLRDFTFTFHFHALEKEMATHSSVLAWRIPGMGEPGGLPSNGVAQSRTQLKRLSSSREKNKQINKVLFPGLRRSPGVGNGNPLQYSCLVNPMDRSLVGYGPWGRRGGHNLVTKPPPPPPPPQGTCSSCKDSPSLCFLLPLGSQRVLLT